MKAVKLPKNESWGIKESDFGHTTNEWGEQKNTPKNIIFTYDLKWNKYRNDDESN